MVYELQKEAVEFIKTLVRLGMVEGFGQTGYLVIEDDGTYLFEVYFD